MKHTGRLWLLYLYSVFLSFEFGSGQVNYGITCSKSRLCECKTGPDHTTATCNFKALKSIPDDLPTNTNFLEIYSAPFDSNTLHRANLSRYSQLKYLYLGEVQLEAVDSDAFADLSDLNHLNLGGNNIKFIQPNTFSGLELDTLALSYNPGIEFRVGSFQGLKTTWLFLHKSALKKLNPEVFMPLKSSLKYLSLFGDDLEELPEELESLFSGLEGLEIGGNPWKCDCKLKWFKEFYDTHSKMFYGTPRCASPKELERKWFDEVTAEEFQCAKYSKWARMWVR